MTAPRYSEITVSVEFPDGTVKAEKTSIGNIPDIDRLCDRVKNTIAREFDMAPTLGGRA